MSDFQDKLKTAIQHAGAWMLMELQKLERGYTSLHPNEEIVQKGVALAKSEAGARGVPANEADVGSQHVIEAAQQIGASGADPHAVAADTKATDTPTEVQGDPEPLHVASTANDPPPPGAIVEGAHEAAIAQSLGADTGSASPLTPATHESADPPRPPDAA
jgi:hypothetical protein